MSVIKDKENYSSKAIKAGVWYTISAVLLRSISIITTPIFTRLLSTEDYGVVTSFTSWYSLLLPICSLNLTYSVAKAKEDFDDNIKQYIGSMTLLSLIFTLLVALVSFLNINLTEKILGFDPLIIGLLFSYLACMEVVQLYQTECRFLYRFKTNVLISIIITIGSVIASLFLIISSTHNRYIARIFGIVIPVFVIAIFILLKTIKQRSFSFNVERNINYWKYALQISVPLIFHVVSISILTQSDRVIIASLRGNAEAGIYGLSYQYGILISVITNAICEAWQPWFFDVYRERNNEKINSAIPGITELGCMVCLGCIAISPEAIWILGGDAYRVGIWVVTPVSLSILCQYVYSHYVNIEMYYKKTSYISFGTIIAATLNIVLNYLFIPRYGFIAAGYTTFASYVVLMLVHFLITKKILYVKLYNDLYLFLMVFIVSVIAFTFTMLFERTVERYILLGLLCVLYFIRNRNSLMNILKKKF